MARVVVSAALRIGAASERASRAVSLISWTLLIRRSPSLP
jgi:hypothetical protein